MVFCCCSLSTWWICITVTFLSASTSLALFIWPLSLTTHFVPQNCCSLDLFCFSHNSLHTVETVVCENQRRSAVSEILKPPCLAPTIIPWSKSLRLHFISILTFGLKNSWTSWSRLHVFMHLAAATWLADYIFALTSLCTGLPNKVVTEYIAGYGWCMGREGYLMNFPTSCEILSANILVFSCIYHTQKVVWIVNVPWVVFHREYFQTLDPAQA